MSFSNVASESDRRRVVTNDGRQTLLTNPDKPLPSPTWRMREGDSKYVNDCRTIQETVRALELHAADVRKETSILGTAHNYTGSKDKVQEAIRKSRASAETAQLCLKGLPEQKVESRSEQSRRKLEEQKLREDLAAALKKLDKAWGEYAIADADKSKRVSTSSASADAPSTASFSSGRTGVSQGGVEMPALDAAERGLAPGSQARQLQMQDQMQDQVSAAEADIHSAIVDEYAGQISTLNQDMRSLQRCMLDLASHTQEQGVLLDSIEGNMTQGVTQTANANQQLAQASQQQQKGTKWICRLLVFALILAIIICLVVSHRNS